LLSLHIMPSCLLHFQTTITLLFIVPNCVYLYVQGISIITALHITCSRYTNNHSFHLGENYKMKLSPKWKGDILQLCTDIFFGTNDTTITIATPEIQRLQSTTTNYLYCFSIYLFEPLSDGLKIHSAHHCRVTLPRTHTITMDTKS